MEDSWETFTQVRNRSVDYNVDRTFRKRKENHMLIDD